MGKNELKYEKYEMFAKPDRLGNVTENLRTGKCFQVSKYRRSVGLVRLQFDTHSVFISSFPEEAESLNFWFK